MPPQGRTEGFRNWFRNSLGSDSQYDRPLVLGHSESGSRNCAVSPPSTHEAPRISEKDDSLHFRGAERVDRL